jgi:hypothetical protein
MLRQVLPLLLVAIAAAAPAHGQRTSPHDMPLPEQLRMNFYDMDRLAAALPGFAGLDRGDCVVHVYMKDTTVLGDSARALFRHTRPGCEGPPAVRLHAARYTWAEIQALQTRLHALLGEPDLRVRGGVTVHPDGTLTVHAQNRAALERARQRLLREPGIPHASIVLRPPPQPEAVDHPVPLPRAAYLAVLDSVAAHVRAGPDFGRFDAADLPAALTPDDLRARGVKPLEPSDRCGTVGAITFREPTQRSDGTYILNVVEGVRPGIADDWYYYLRADDAGRWHVFRALRSGDLVLTGCPVEPQP